MAADGAFLQSQGSLPGLAYQLAAFPYNQPNIPMKATFGYTIIHVNNVFRTIEWYEAVFGLQRRFVAPDGSYAELQTGEVTLSISANSLEEKSYPNFRRNNLLDEPGGFHISFVTDEVNALYQHAIEQGAVGAVAPNHKPWRQQEAWIRDLNGVLVTLVSPRQPD